jgi:hypothetical protein
MKHLFFLIIALTAFSQLDCSGEKLDRSMVLGVYSFQSNQGIELLILKSDSTYLQSFTALNGDQFSNSGTWEFYFEGNTPRIKFKEFILNMAAATTNKSYIRPGYSSSFIEVPLISGNIKIVLSKDFDYWYTKVGPRQ